MSSPENGLQGTLTVDSTENHDSSIIWMHGLGATARDFHDMPRFIQRPCTRWIFPQAPHRPVTLNDGWVMPSWFDIRYLGRDGDGDRESREEAMESAALIRSLIEDEIESGIPSDRIALIGFSQGGAMALFEGCRHPNKLAAMVCLSGYLLFPDDHMKERSESNRDTPVLLQHGTHDPMVPFDAGRQSAKFLTENGWPTEFDRYPMGHEVCMPEINRIGNFLSTVLDGESQ